MATGPPALPFSAKPLSEQPDRLAPDGSEARLLFEGQHGGLAHFTLPAGTVARAVRHRTVEEIWFVVRGRGQIWRRYEGEASVIDLDPGTSCTIPRGAEFQFRARVEADLVVLIATMPPWPGDHEAISIQGKWFATVDAGE